MQEIKGDVKTNKDNLISYEGIVTDDSLSNSAIYTLDQVRNSPTRVIVTEPFRSYSLKTSCLEEMGYTLLFNLRQTAAQTAQKGKI